MEKDLEIGNPTVTSCGQSRKTFNVIEESEEYYIYIDKHGDEEDIKAISKHDRKVDVVSICIYSPIR